MLAFAGVTNAEGNTAGPLAEIKAVAPNCASCHYFLHLQALAIKKVPASLQIKQQKIVNLIKYQGWVHIILILCVLKWEIPCGTDILRKSIWTISWVVSWVSHLIYETSFLLERRTNELWLFWRGYLADSFLKVNVWVYHFKEDNWQYLWTMIKFKLSSKKLGFRKKLVSITLKASDRFSRWHQWR